jgi:hypothetical protein
MRRLTIAETIDTAVVFQGEQRAQRRVSPGFSTGAAIPGTLPTLRSLLPLTFMPPAESGERNLGDALTSYTFPQIHLERQDSDGKR